MHRTFMLIWAAEAMWMLALFGEAIRRAEPAVGAITLGVAVLLSALSWDCLREARKP